MSAVLSAFPPFFSAAARQIYAPSSVVPATARDAPTTARVAELEEAAAVTRSHAHDASLRRRLFTPPFSRLQEEPWMPQPTEAAADGSEVASTGGALSWSIWQARPPEHPSHMAGGGSVSTAAATAATEATEASVAEGAQARSKYKIV